MMKLLQVHCCTIQNMSGTLFCLVGVVLWHNPKLHSMYKLNCLSGFSHICMYTSQDKDAGDKASDNKSSYTGSIEEPEPGKGMFPQPLDNICQRGEQIRGVWTQSLGNLRLLAGSGQVKRRWLCGKKQRKYQAKMRPRSGWIPLTVRFIGMTMASDRQANAVALLSCMPLALFAWLPVCLTCCFPRAL